MDGKAWSPLERSRLLEALHALDPVQQQTHLRSSPNQLFSRRQKLEVVLFLKPLSQPEPGEMYSNLSPSPSPERSGNPVKPGPGGGQEAGWPQSESPTPDETGRWDLAHWAPRTAPSWLGKQEAGQTLGKGTVSQGQARATDTFRAQDSGVGWEWGLPTKGCLQGASCSCLHLLR